MRCERKAQLVEQVHKHLHRQDGQLSRVADQQVVVDKAEDMNAHACHPLPKELSHSLSHPAEVLWRSSVAERETGASQESPRRWMADHQVMTARLRDRARPEAIAEIELREVTVLLHHP